MRCHGASSSGSPLLLVAKTGANPRLMLRQEGFLVILARAGSVPAEVLGLDRLAEGEPRKALGCWNSVSSSIMEWDFPRAPETPA